MRLASGVMPASALVPIKPFRAKRGTIERITYVSCDPKEILADSLDSANTIYTGALCLQTTDAD